LSPSQKAEEIRKLKEKGYIVAFVGDGINDAVALTEADIGIAIGNGTDIAMDAAGAVLMSPDILKTSVLIQLSKKSGRIIKQNLFWAFFYNIICIPIAAGCFSALGLIATPMVSAAAMSLSSVCVVLNSLRIDYNNKKEKKTESVSKETKAEEHMKTVKIEGMMCMHCVSRVKQAFKDKGIDAEVDLESGTCRLNEDIQVEVIKEIVEQAGYKLGE
ncbi:MAG: HAD-IC family P-type ATPase, partial [Clostridia bacterium]|nr:HAD-IC family P-type ATPase [Clostridia bacterium]